MKWKLCDICQHIVAPHTLASNNKFSWKFSSLRKHPGGQKSQLEMTRRFDSDAYFDKYDKDEIIILEYKNLCHSIKKRSYTIIYREY